MSARQPRPDQRRGRPWKKESREPAQFPPTPKEHQDRMLAALKTAAERFDVAALVETVREYQAAGQPPPEWAVLGLEDWLTEFAMLAITRRAGQRAQWVRGWRRAFIDSVIADHLEGRREFYGLTWAEAADEAADHFRETPAAGGPAAMLAAYKRHRKRPPRPTTRWEFAMAHIVDPPRSRHGGWWIINQDRQGRQRGEWRERPALTYAREHRELGRKRA